MNMQSNVSSPRPLSLWEQLLIGTSWRNAYRLLPGVVLALSVMLIANRVSSWLGQVLLRMQGLNPEGKASGISGMTCAILLGLLLANVFQVRPAFRPGLEFCVRKLLRLGIILVGIKLSFIDVLRLGLWGIPVVVVVIVSALVLTTWFARRLGLGTRLGTLAAASTAICGVTAALAVAPTIDADDREVAYTVANVTLFGMVAMFVYPYLAHSLFARQPGAAGLFLGTAIHDTSQVMAAALSYNQVFGDELAMKVATMTKLTRNVFLVGVVPLLAFLNARQRGTERKRISVAKLFPLFVLGFAAMALVRSVGDAGIGGVSARAFGMWNLEIWKDLTKTLGETVAYGALGAAMASVGLTTHLNTFRVLGLKPLYVGAMSATVVGAVALLLAMLVGPRIDAHLAKPTSLPPSGTISRTATVPSPSAPIVAPSPAAPSAAESVKNATGDEAFPDAFAPSTAAVVVPDPEPRRANELARRHRKIKRHRIHKRAR
jgi:uncharacterized integral membrane protein (TIGR00698 family)